MAQPVAAGQIISEKALTSAEVAGVEGAIPSTELADLLGKTAAVGLVPGQVVLADMVTDGSVPGADERVVGVEVDPTRAPSGLAPGDVVMVIAVPPAGDPSTTATLSDPTVLADQAIVQRLGRVEGGGSRLALLVPREVANRVAAYGAAGRVAVLQTPVGGDD